MEKNINFKKEKGITLVALVVTIIVLLILAFVAISMIMGDNGVVEKAKESKEETIKAQEREFIKLAYQDLEMDYRLKGTDITADRVMEKLSEYDKNIKVEMITKDDIGDTEVVVEKNSGEEYAEIVYTETEHKYAGSLVIDENKARYEVTYNANRGSGGPTKQVKIEGTPLTITLERPERKGYNFIGWARESTAVVAEYMSGSQYTEDANITLYAVWQMRDDIEPVAQIGSTKYPSIQEAIYDCSQAGEEATTILLLTDTEEEFRTYEGQNIILNLQGHTVTSKSEGALCTNNGKLQIINGELRSEKGTAITNNGEITIGDNSNGIDDNTPTIYGNNIGVENKGTFNFYDGKIQGKVPIQGTTPNTPDQYGAVQTTYENGIATVQLRILTGYEARIGWVYYETLQGAIDIAKAKETVTMIRDLQLKEVLEVSETKDVILDLYGYELTVASGLDTVIKNYGNLEITDNSVEQTGDITIISSSTCYGVKNEGDMTLKIIGCKININGSNNNSSTYGIYNVGIGRVELIRGIINCTSANNNSSSYGIYNENNGNIEIKESIINSSRSDGTWGNSYGVYNKNNGIIELKNGTINSINNKKGYISSSYGIYNKTGNIILEEEIINVNSLGSSSYDGNAYGIYNSAGIIQIKNSTLEIVAKRALYNFSYGIYNINGKIEINKGNIKSIGSMRAYGILNKETGTINMLDGTINGSLTNDGTGSIEINGGEINSSIINENIGNIYINGGTINSNVTNEEAGNIEINKGTINGEVANEKNGKLIIGNKDATELIQQPCIKSNNIGLSNINTGTVEFYDGSIQGKTALSGTISKTRENYKIVKNNKDGMEIIQLEEKIAKDYIVQVDETKYYTLKEAIESIGEEEKTIHFLRDFELDETIKFNKNIILDLNGHTMTNNFYKIENVGNLVITDLTESKEGRIESSSIYNTNNGNIVIEAGTINCNDYGIYNKDKGKLTLNGGKIDSPKYGIYNESSGDITIAGGVINVDTNVNNGYGIYNKADGNIIIRDGEINCKGTFGTRSIQWR